MVILWWRFTDSNRGPVDYDEEKSTGQEKFFNYIIYLQSCFQKYISEYISRRRIFRVNLTPEPDTKPHQCRQNLPPQTHPHETV